MSCRQHTLTYDTTRLTLGKSLMYIRKSKGPNIEPWGTPIEIDFVSDLESLYSTY